jgi:shikimate dehydrogenase
MSVETVTNPKACVIGWPVAHSRSPMIHSFWLQRLKLAGSYERAAVAPEDFPDFIRDLPGKGFVGGNVTLPHKQRAFELCRHPTETATKLQAVNTLWLEAGELCGDNTDVGGFLDALDQDAPGWGRPFGKAVVLGAGGAARAIVHALSTRGIQLGLINRSKARAEQVAMQSDAQIAVHDWAELSRLLVDADLLVNTTSLGMKGQPPLQIDLAPMPAHAVVSDIVYVPLETELLRQAKARGLCAVSGVGMLLHQAAPGFARWFGVKPDVTAELRRLVEADVLKSA